MNRCFHFSEEEYGGTYSSVKEVENIQSYINDTIIAVKKNK